VLAGAAAKALALAAHDARGGAPAARGEALEVAAGAKLSPAQAAARAAADDVAALTRRPMSREHRDTGGVSFAVYASYFRAAGGLVWFAPLVAVISCERFMYASCDWWLAQWTLAEDEGARFHAWPRNGTEFDVAATAQQGRVFGIDVGLGALLPRVETQGDRMWWMQRHLLIGVCTAVFVALRMFVMMVGTGRASGVIFLKLLAAVRLHRSPTPLARAPPPLRLPALTPPPYTHTPASRSDDAHRR
jgi:hypothetical protein